MACEDLCYKDFIKIQAKDGINSKELSTMIDEKEECLTECFIARRGTQDAEYCIERCNETFN